MLDGISSQLFIYLYSKDVYIWYINVCLVFASVVCVCLQEGFTAVLTAAHNGRLTVLRTLVEQYGGDVLHRKKVM